MSEPFTEAGRALVSFVQRGNVPIDGAIAGAFVLDIEEQAAEARSEGLDALRAAIRYDAIPTLLVFADNAGVRSVIAKLRAALSQHKEPNRG